MNLFMIPERIRIVLGLDAETRALIDRVLDIAEGKPQAKIDALAKRIGVVRQKIGDAIRDHPDPNPND